MRAEIVSEEYRVSRAAVVCLAVLVGIHLAMLPDYFADNDLGYHISL